MHKSLSQRANLIVMSVNAGGVAVVLGVTGNTVFASCLVGFGFGLAAGYFRDAFCDVRRVLSSSRVGTIAISMTWVCGLVLLIVAMSFVTHPATTPSRQLVAAALPQDATSGEITEDPGVGSGT